MSDLSYTRWCAWGVFEDDALTFSKVNQELRAFGYGIIWRPTSYRFVADGLEGVIAGGDWQTVCRRAIEYLEGNPP